MTDLDKEPTPPEENGQAEPEEAVEKSGSAPESTAQPIETDDEFAARYHHAKSKKLEKFSKEMEERNARDTKKKRRNWWIKTVLMLVLIAGSIAIMFGLGSYLGGDETLSFVDMLKGINLPYFAALIAVLIFYMIVESAKYSWLLKITTGKFSPRISVKTMFLGKYYDGITPLGTGGQPFQIYYLHKKKVPAGAANSIPLVRYIISTFVFCIAATVMMALSPRFFTAEEGQAVTYAIRILAWVSMGFNLLVPVIIVFVSIFPRAGKKLVVWLVWLLYKMHIVKRRYAVTKKYVYEIGEYRNSMKFYAKKWWKLIPLVLLSVLEVATYLMTPFFVVISIANVEPTATLLLHTCCLCMISFYSASLVPTPGNSGAVEATTSLVFVTVGAAITPVLGWVVFFWRFTTFYLYILSGIGINIFEIIRSAVRNKRASKKD